MVLDVYLFNIILFSLLLGSIVVRRTCLSNTNIYI